jgi:hypothetical protein
MAQTSVVLEDSSSCEPITAEVKNWGLLSSHMTCEMARFIANQPFLSGFSTKRNLELIVEIVGLATDSGCIERSWKKASMCTRN